jgi:hypothetical protein
MYKDTLHFHLDFFVLIPRASLLYQAGSDTEVLRLLAPFGLRDVHIESFFGKVLQRVQCHGEWLKERRAVEQMRERHR